MELLPGQKLTPDDVREVRKMLRKDTPPKEIARYFGVSVRTVRAIKYGQIWSWVT